MNNFSTILEAAIALGVIIAVLVAIADTPLYPLAFGAVLIAFLYEMLNNAKFSRALPDLVGWAGAHL